MTCRPRLPPRSFFLGQRLAKCLKSVFKVERVGFVFTGNDVKHTHAHVVTPHDRTDISSILYIAETDLTFVGRPRASDREMSKIAAEIIRRLRHSG